MHAGSANSTDTYSLESDLAINFRMLLPIKDRSLTRYSLVLVKLALSGIVHVCTIRCGLSLACSDCTVKIWDIASGNEVSALSKHHSYVRKVTYSPENRLVFTACQSVIKVRMMQTSITYAHNLTVSLPCSTIGLPCLCVCMCVCVYG